MSLVKAPLSINQTFRHNIHKKVNKPMHYVDTTNSRQKSLKSTSERFLESTVSYFAIKLTAANQNKICICSTKREKQQDVVLVFHLIGYSGKIPSLSAKRSAFPYWWLARRLANFCWSTTTRAAAVCCSKMAASVTSRHVVSWPAAEPATKNSSPLSFLLLARAHTWSEANSYWDVGHKPLRETFF
jgi:hypothetical protein